MIVLFGRQSDADTERVVCIFFSFILPPEWGARYVWSDMDVCYKWRWGDFGCGVWSLEFCAWHS